MGLPNVARYPEATVVRDETSILIRFGGPDGEQKMSVPLQYVGGDAETAELRLLARLQQIGYSVRRGELRTSQTLDRRTKKGCVQIDDSVFSRAHSRTLRSQSVLPSDVLSSTKRVRTSLVSDGNAMLSPASTYSPSSSKKIVAPVSIVAPDLVDA